MKSHIFHFYFVLFLFTFVSFFALNAYAQSTQPAATQPSKLDISKKDKQNHAMRMAYRKLKKPYGKISIEEAKMLASTYLKTFIAHYGVISKVKEKDNFYLAETVTGFGGKAGPTIQVSHRGGILCEAYPSVAYIARVDRVIIKSPKKAPRTQPATQPKPNKTINKKVQSMKEAYKLITMPIAGLHESISKKDAMILANAYTHNFITHFNSITKINEKDDYYEAQTIISSKNEAGPKIRVYKKNAGITCKAHPHVIYIQRTDDVFIIEAKSYITEKPTED